MGSRDELEKEIGYCVILLLLLIAIVKRLCFNGYTI